MGRKKYTDEFKKQVGEAAAKGNKTFKQLSEEFDVHTTLVSNWKKDVLSGKYTNTGNKDTENIDDQDSNDANRNQKYVPEYGTIIQFDELEQYLASFDEDITFSTCEAINIVAAEKEDDEYLRSGLASQISIISGNEYEPKDEDYTENDDGDEIYKGQPYALAFLPDNSVISLSNDAHYNEFLGFLSSYYIDHAPDVKSGKIDWNKCGLSSVKPGIQSLIDGVILLAESGDDSSLDDFVDSNPDVVQSAADNLFLATDGCNDVGFWYFFHEVSITYSKEGNNFIYEYEGDEEEFSVSEFGDEIYFKAYEAGESGDSATCAMEID
jgi:transposase-like protein